MRKFSRYAVVIKPPKGYRGFYASSGYIINRYKIQPDINRVKACFCQMIHSFPDILTAYPVADGGKLYFDYLQPIEIQRLIDFSLENIENEAEMRRVAPPEELTLPFRIFVVRGFLYLVFSHDIFNGYKVARIRRIFFSMLNPQDSGIENNLLKKSWLPRVRPKGRIDLTAKTIQLTAYFLKLSLLRMLPTRKLKSEDSSIVHRNIQYRSIAFSAESEALVKQALLEQVSVGEVYIRYLAKAFFSLTSEHRFSALITADMHKYAVDASLESPGSFTATLPISATRWNANKIRIDHSVVNCIGIAYYHILDLFDVGQSKGKNSDIKEPIDRPLDIRKPVVPVFNYGDLSFIISIMDRQESSRQLSCFIQNAGGSPVILFGLGKDYFELTLSYNSAHFGQDEAFFLKLIETSLSYFGVKAEVQHEKWP